ncbi:hypothetical protein RUM43_008741 [Polyplax serrata]|uniref:Uncharacterized protein n=1 Tax=Polyplax serrata TaxID=468196 RepID=A0AAN8NU51_POLSC
MLIITIYFRSISGCFGNLQTVSGYWKKKKRKDGGGGSGSGGDDDGDDEGWYREGCRIERARKFHPDSFKISLNNT